MQVCVRVCVCAFVCVCVCARAYELALGMHTGMRVLAGAGVAHVRARACAARR